MNSALHTSWYWIALYFFFFFSLWGIAVDHQVEHCNITLQLTLLSPYFVHTIATAIAVLDYMVYCWPLYFVRYHCHCNITLHGTLLALQGGEPHHRIRLPDPSKHHQYCGWQKGSFWRKKYEGSLCLHNFCQVKSVNGVGHCIQYTHTKMQNSHMHMQEPCKRDIRNVI